MTPSHNKTTVRRPKTATLSVTLPHSVHRRVELAALNAGKSESKIIVDALALWFQRTGQSTAAPRVLVPGTMWDYADHYLKAARVLLATDPLDAVAFHPVFPHLVGHSVETGLKAFLSARGMTEAELRNSRSLGHDLVKLLGAARKLKLDHVVRTTSGDRQVIGALNRLYEPRQLMYASNVAGQWVRKSPPPARRLLAVAEKLTAGVRPIYKIRPARPK